MTLALFFVLYCIEAGLFFIFAPWTRFWTTNPLVQQAEVIGLYLGNPWVRGLVSGFGVAHLLVALREIAVIFRRRREYSAR